MHYNSGPNPGLVQSPIYILGNDITYPELAVLNDISIDVLDKNAFGGQEFIFQTKISTKKTPLNSKIHPNSYGFFNFYCNYLLVFVTV